MQRATQFEAGWCLVNIASGDSRFVEILIKHGMVKRFIEMVQEGSPRIQEQSMWGLGNVAGDCYNARNLVLREGLVPVLIDYLNTPGGLPVSALRNTVWTMSNLVRGKPKPELEAVLPLVALAARFAAHDDAEVRRAPRSPGSCPTTDMSTGAEAGCDGRTVDAVLPGGGRRRAPQPGVRAHGRLHAPNPDRAAAR